MTSFWEAFESTTRAEPAFGRDRQRRFAEAEAKASEFYERMRSGSDRLKQLGIYVAVRDRTVSFRQGELEVLAITFGSNDGTEVRIFGPVVEYLKLTPSVEDLDMDHEIDAPAGEWLGKSIDVVKRNRDTFAALGLV